MHRVTQSHHHTQCSLFELPVVVLFLYVCFLPPSIYSKLCKQCIFMVLKIFIKCGDIVLLKTNENVSDVSNHDIKTSLTHSFLWGFPCE